MMRKRPTAVYRIIDEEDLLSGADYLDTPADRSAVAVEVYAHEADAPEPADHADRGAAAGLDGLEPGDHADFAGVAGQRPRPQRRVLFACAGALVVAVLVARLASLLLAGVGSVRAGRPAGGHRAGDASAVAGTAVPVLTGGLQPAVGRAAPLSGPAVPVPAGTPRPAGERAAVQPGGDRAAVQPAGDRVVAAQPAPPAPVPADGPRPAGGRGEASPGLSLPAPAALPRRPRPGSRRPPAEPRPAASNRTVGSQAPREAVGRPTAASPRAETDPRRRSTGAISGRREFGFER
jgi:hypothetical protein